MITQCSATQRPAYNIRLSCDYWIWIDRSISGFGCYIGSQFFGCIMYADDLIMLSPLLKGLQSMFNRCDAYAKTHFLIFTAKKRSLCQ